MGCLATIYVLVVLWTGVPAFWQSGFVLGLCGTISPFVAKGGASGVAEAMRTPVATRAWIAVPIGMLVTGAAIWWPVHVGWHFTMFGYDVPGWTENLVGAGLGIIQGSSRRLKATPEPTTPPY